MSTTNDSNLPQKMVFIFDAAENMRLSQDVVSSDGHLIATKGTALTLEIISKISDYNILEINVYDQKPQIEDIPLQAADSEQETYYERIRKSDAFREFHESYLSNVATVKSNLNGIVRNNDPVNTVDLLKGTTDLLQKYTNTLQIFDMLHSMREMDDLTFVHCVNVAIISSVIGKWLKFSQTDIEVLTLCGLLHDIGKLLIPDEVLNKPERLTANEYAIMKEHVNLGYQTIKNTDIDDRVKSAVLLHHEKCDGSGYPFKLMRTDIPDFTKIITIADIYDAMTANRVYRSAICPFTVIKNMERDAFTKFDPKFSMPFLENVASSYIGNNVKLSDGRIGEVIMLNKNNLGSPIVSFKKGQFVDLSKEKDLEITAIL